MRLPVSAANKADLRLRHGRATPGNRSPLLVPPHRQRPLQLPQHHLLIRPPAEDRLNDVRRQQGQPQGSNNPLWARELDLQSVYAS
jgi:hypothetical protein